LDENIQVFLLRNPPNEQKPYPAVTPESLPEVCLASFRFKEAGIESARQYPQFARIDPAFDPTSPVLLGVNKDGVELTVEPMHVFPGQTFEKAILSQDANVLRKVGVIDPANLE